MTLSDYIETIAGAMSTPVTYKEGKEWEVNLELDNVEVFPVLYFRNYLTATYTRDRAGRILYADYPVTVELMSKQDYLDDTTTTLDDSIFATLSILAQEFIKRIYLSSEYQTVADQTGLQQYSMLAFRDKYDVIVAGMQINATIRLYLGEDSCI